MSAARAAPPEPDEAGEATTVDAFLGGRVTLIQPKTGHRAGLDAALLQALVPGDAAGTAIDLGAGVGTVAFCVAARAPGLEVTGVERDEGLVALGRAALARPENAGFAGRVALVADDAEAFGKGDPGTADIVLMNPPFDAPGRARPSPDERRRAAHVGPAGLLDAWCRSAARLLRSGGRLCMIHRATALPDVLAGLSGRFGGVSVLPVHPADDAPASRILVSAVRGSRAALTLRPGLVLHAPDGGWTPEADAVLRGNATL